MIKTDTYLDRRFCDDLFMAELDKEKAHKSSGKLSASQLANPLQWQILKSYFISGDPIDDYAVRLFARGRQVEDFIMQNITGVIDKQQFVEYRGCIGYYDAIVDCSQWDFPSLEPRVIEVKSVSNMKFKRVKQNGFDRSWVLQGALYALALGLKEFAVVCVASDDFRMITHVYEAAEYKAEIDSIIDEYNKWKASGRIPAFVAKEDWQNNVKYNRFPDWVGLTEQECTDRMRDLLPSPEKLLTQDESILTM